MKDPHHIDIEWKFENGKFYHRQIPTNRWVEMKRIHITPKRIIALYEMINLSVAVNDLPGIKDSLNFADQSLSKVIREVGDGIIDKEAIKSVRNIIKKAIKTLTHEPRKQTT